MQSKSSIESHLEKLYRAKPSKSLKIKAILYSVILYWENKLKECKL